MKKLISMVLTLSMLLVCFAVPTVSAAGDASVASDDFSFVPSGDASINGIKEDVNALLGGDITKAELSDKYGAQLRSLDICISGIKNLNDIYGIQFSVKASSDKVALVYLETNLQNSEKIGTSRWEAYMSHRDTAYKSALVLMYGTRAVTAEPNNIVNKVTSDKYKIAKLYYLVDSGLEEDFTLTYKVEDIASKDSTGTVKSISSQFKEKSVCTAEFQSENDEMSAKILGAQIRVSGAQGLRFGTRLEKDDYFNKCTDISYGTLIAVTNQLGNEELTLESECRFLDSKARVLEDTDNYICFTGEITDFPKNGDYDSVNFTARSYVKYKAPKDDKYTVVYTEPIVRNVSQIKSIIGMK